MSLLIRYSFAIRASDGTVIHISEAKKDEKYTCYICEESFVLRKGNQRQHHFAHSPNVSACAESDLHKRTKILLSKVLESQMEQNGSFRLQFKCRCSNYHSINILSNVNSVLVEKKVQIKDNWIQPDISLLSRKVTKWGIEIICSHDLETITRDFYRSNNIGCIKIKVTNNNFQKILKSAKRNNLLRPGMFEIFSLPKNLLTRSNYIGLSNLKESISWFLCDKTEPAKLIETKRGLQIMPCYRNLCNDMDDFRIPCEDCKYKVDIKNDKVTCQHPDFFEAMFRTQGSNWRKFDVSFYYSSGKRKKLELDYSDIIKQSSYQSLEWLAINPNDEYFQATFHHGKSKWEPYSNDVEGSLAVLNTKLGFGEKHPESKLIDVLKTDSNYIKWVLAQGPSVSSFPSPWNKFHNRWDKLIENLPYLVDFESIDPEIIEIIIEVDKLVENEKNVNVDFNDQTKTEQEYIDMDDVFSIS